METPEQQVERILAERGDKPKTGRPRKDVDERAVFEAAKVLCTMEEIAAICGVSVDTLERRFADVIEKGRCEGRASLRRQQYAVAMNPRVPGSATMLVWLGKVVLGQRETTNLEVSGPNGGPIAHADTTDETLQAYALEALATVEAAERICAESLAASGEPAADGTR